MLRYSPASMTAFSVLSTVTMSPLFVTTVFPLFVAILTTDWMCVASSASPKRPLAIAERIKTRNLGLFVTKKSRVSRSTWAKFALWVGLMPGWRTSGASVRQKTANSSRVPYRFSTRSMAVRSFMDALWHIS